MKTHPLAKPRRVAVVTGANRGIGFEICRQLARRGLRVVLTSRSTADGMAACRQLADEGLDVHHTELDVADDDSVARFAAWLQATHGGADVLVNNAGVMLDEADERALTCPLVKVRATLETNLYGSLRLCQALIPTMVARGYGRVVNVSSGAGQLTTMGHNMPAYRLSKVGLNALTRMLAADLSETNVLVNSMDPGAVRTRMGGSAAPRSIERGADTAVWLATMPDQSHRRDAFRLRYIIHRLGALIAGWKVHRGGFFRDRRPIPW